MAVASVVFLPVTLWTLPTGGVPAAAWPFVVATVVLHALYFYDIADEIHLESLSELAGCRAER